MGRGENGMQTPDVHSKPGMNIGHPSQELYVAARKEVISYLGDSKGLQKIPEGHERYHFIHGKAYDLRKFAKLHPGGADIVEMTAGVVDTTPIFESYHAFADRDGILEKLEKYRVPDEEVPGGIPAPIYSFKEGGFYDTVTKRVRKYFGATTDKLDESVTKNIKTTWEWYIMVVIQLILNIVFWVSAFVFRLPTPVAAVCAFLAGIFQIQWGFTAMHDASHFGLSTRGGSFNDIVMRVWCSWSLWNGKVWAQHHIVRHHGFTGSPELDPDIIHAVPMVRKHPDTDPGLENGLLRWIGDTFGWPGWVFSAILFYVFLPGLWLGQAGRYAQYIMAPKSSYFNIDTSKEFWGLPPYETLKGFDPRWWEWGIYFFQIGMNIFRFSPAVSFTYILGLNIAYCICIVADHDLVESAVLNHIDVEVTNPLGSEPDNEPNSGSDKPNHDRVKQPDWGEVQVRNTTNFCNDKLHVFAALHGSINYQIEHHLFPGVNHIHLPKIAPIVRETAKEFGVPYVTYPRLWEAWLSFVMVMRAVMTNKDSVEDLKKMQ